MHEEIGILNEPQTRIYHTLELYPRLCLYLNPLFDVVDIRLNLAIILITLSGLFRVFRTHINCGKHCK